MRNTTVASAQARLLQALRALGGPERAEWEKRYQKSRWEHWGVPLPKMDVAIRETLGDLPARRRRSLGRIPACADAARGAGLHPALGEGRARSRTRAPVSGGTWREADRRRQARGDEVFEGVKPVSVERRS
jgi:hypothetical protein